jgi:hypothetical protein
VSRITSRYSNHTPPRAAPMSEGSSLGPPRVPHSRYKALQRKELRKCILKKLVSSSVEVSSEKIKGTPDTFIMKCARTVIVSLLAE